LEADLRVALGVEELGRLQMGRQVLVLDADRVGAHGADELGLAVLVDVERGVEVLESATEGRDDHVLDREPRSRMNLVELPGPGRKLFGCYRHGVQSFRVVGMIACASTIARNRTAVRFALYLERVDYPDRAPDRPRAGAARPRRRDVRARRRRAQPGPDPRRRRTAVRPTRRRERVDGRD